jgi:hypothetical protein
MLNLHKSIVSAFIFFVFIAKLFVFEWLIFNFNTPILYLHNNFLFQVAHNLEIPLLINQNIILSILIDIGIILFSFIGIFKNNSKIYTTLIILIIIYYININSKLPNVEHRLLFLIFTSPLLLLNSIKSFNLYSRFLQIYFCYIFFDAGLWKLIRYSGDDHLGAILIQQNISYLNQSTLNWIINKSTIFNFLYLVVMAIQLFFCVGFFTRKLNSILILLFTIISFSNYLLADLLFYEMWIGIYVLVLKPIIAENSSFSTD